MLLILTAASIVSFVLWYRLKVWVYPDNFPPGLRLPLPLIGDAWALGKDLAPGIIDLHRKHGNLVGFSLGGTPAVSISDFETIQEALAKPEFNSRPPQPGIDLYRREVGPPRPAGLVLVDGDTWSRIHRFSLR